MGTVIIAREWWDRTYGNTYQSIRVVQDGRVVYTGGLHYGHGHLTAEQRAAEHVELRQPVYTEVMRVGRKRDAYREGVNL